MELWVIIWLICGFVAGNVLANKGRSGFKGFIMGFLLGPLGVLIAFVMDSNRDKLDQQAVAEGKGRKCPYCAEMVKPEAIKCRHCGSDI